MSNDQDIYEEHVLDHYEDPYHRGDLQSATHAHEADNPLCGDVIHIDLKLTPEGTIAAEDLPVKIRGGQSGAVPGGAAVSLGEDGINLNSAVTEFEKALILQSLEKTQWVKNKAAQLLNLNRTTLVEKIKRHQLTPQKKTG